MLDTNILPQADLYGPETSVLNVALTSRLFEENNIKYTHVMATD